MNIIESLSRPFRYSNWVLFTTEDSTERGNWSIAAALEVVAFCIAAIWLNVFLADCISRRVLQPLVEYAMHSITGFNGDYRLTHLSYAIPITLFFPLILMRSKKSTALGSRWLNSYWEQKELSELSISCKIIMTLLSCIFAYYTASWLSLTLDKSYSLVMRSTIIAALSFAIAVFTFMTYKCNLTLRTITTRGQLSNMIIFLCVSAGIGIGAYRGSLDWELTAVVCLVTLVLNCLIFVARKQDLVNLDQGCNEKDIRRLSPIAVLVCILILSTFSAMYLVGFRDISTFATTGVTEALIMVAFVRIRCGCSWPTYLKFFSYNNDDSYRDVSKKREGSLTRYQDSNWIATIFTLPYLIALLVRVLLIRVVASLVHFREGVSTIPENLRKLCWISDFRNTVSLMPGANEVSSNLGSKGLKTNLNFAGYADANSATAFWEYLILFQGTVAYILVGNLYRLTLKSIVWVWFPLAVVVFYWDPSRSSKVQSDIGPWEKVDNRTKLTLIWASRAATLSIIAYTAILGLYLFSRISAGNFLVRIHAAAEEVILPLMELILFKREMLFDVLKPTLLVSLPTNTRDGLIILYLPLILISLFVLANQMTALFKKDLDDRKVHELSRGNWVRYVRLAQSLEWVRVSFWVAIVELVWACILIQTSDYFSFVWGDAQLCR